MIVFKCVQCREEADFSIKLNGKVVLFCCSNCIDSCNEIILQRALQSTSNFNVTQIMKVSDIKELNGKGN